MTTIPEQKPGHVLVELVWPESRGEKEDCKNRTGVVWSGRGDVQNYPENLWPRLKEHHDVWRLYEASGSAHTTAAPPSPTQEGVDGEEARQDDDLQLRQQEAAGKNTDLVAVMVGFEDDSSEAEEQAPEDPAAEPAVADLKAVAAHTLDKGVPLLLTRVDLESMSVQDVRQLAIDRDYMLNPRLKAEKLFVEFLAMQALRAKTSEKTA